MIAAQGLCDLDVRDDTLVQEEKIGGKAFLPTPAPEDDAGKRLTAFGGKRGDASDVPQPRPPEISLLAIRTDGDRRVPEAIRRAMQSFAPGLPPTDVVPLQGLIDRMRQGDSGARRKLLERACGRLRRLAGKVLCGPFPIVQQRHELDSVVH